MTTVTTPVSERNQASAQAGTGDVFQRIKELATGCRTASAFYRSVLSALADHFDASFAAINMSQATDSLTERVANGAVPEFFERVTQASVLESEASGEALARVYEIDGTQIHVAVLSVPLRDDHHSTGALGLVTRCRDRSSAESQLFVLRSLAALICSLASMVQSSHGSRGEVSDDVQRAVAKAAKFDSVTELAFAITNGLKTKFQCDQVALGKVEKSRVRLLSLSGMDALYPRSPGTRLIRQAMEECLDNGQTIYSKPGEQWSDRGPKQDFRLHRQWRSAIGEASVASVPLFADDRCVAVLSLTRPGGVGFGREELEEIERLVGAYGPALQLVARASRGWWAQTRDTLTASLVWLVAGNRWGRKVLAAAALVIAAWFFAGHVDYRLTTPCELVPTQVQHLGAPFEGMIRSAHVEPGDQVQAGQLLYVMDTRQLLLQQRELEAEAAVARLDLAQAVSGHKLDAAALAQAELKVIAARLAGVNRRIELAHVKAPADGTIMAGDVKKQVGSVVPLGEPLLEFAPHGKWEVEIRIDDKDAQAVRLGQAGRFVTIARPDQPIACVVRSVRPAATVVDGNNVFVARAAVAGHPSWVLAGMDGVATLEVGRRRVWWVALHRVIRFVRLHFWI